VQCASDCHEVSPVLSDKFNHGTKFTGYNIIIRLICVPMPQILDDAVRSIRKENPKLSESSAYAIATKQLQKSGDLKEGTQEPTKKGSRRGEMSKATRAKTRSKRYKMERERGKKDERNTSGRN